MARYRVTIPYAGPDGADWRFSGGFNCPTAQDARGSAVASFHDLSLATGFQSGVKPVEQDVVIEETDPRSIILLEHASLEVAPGVFCMTLRGPLESHTALYLDKEVYRLQQYGGKRLAVDLGQAHPIGSAGLGVLLNLHDRLDLQLIRVPPNARKMIQTLGLEPTLNFFGSFPEALQKPPRA